jgi:hypothetical protein
MNESAKCGLKRAYTRIKEDVMLDLIGAIFASAYFALLVGTIAVYLARNLATRWLVGTVVWGTIVVALAAVGAFAPGATGKLPAPGLAFIAALLALFGAFGLSASFRSALLAIPMPVLVGLNIGRIGGVFFLLLLADQRLSSPFASGAGWGDIITGLAAIPLTFALARNATFVRPVALWNAFGILDLIDAILLGLLSAPGTPFQVFTTAPGTIAMSNLPWTIIPTILVPILFLLHLTIAAKLGSAYRAGHAQLAQLA